MKTMDERITALEKSMVAIIVEKAVGELDKPETSLMEDAIPKLKIDMSVCIDGIDCEFYRDDEFTKSEIAPLHSIRGKFFLVNESNTWSHCRPRMNHIHASPNGWDKCPIPEGFIIQAYYISNGHEVVSNNYRVGSESLIWENILMFKVTRIAEGYTHA